MARYDFECDCGRRLEHQCSMSERPESLPCDCGGRMVQVIKAVPYVYTRFAEYQFRPDSIVGNNGVLAGRDAQQQHEGYRKQIEALKTAHGRRSRSGSRHGCSVDGVRVAGVMPGEMADSIGQQEGDKEAVYKDPDYWFKATGLNID